MHFEKFAPENNQIVVRLASSRRIGSKDNQIIGNQSKTLMSPA